MPPTMYKLQPTSGYSAQKQACFNFFNWSMINCIYLWCTIYFDTGLHCKLTSYFYLCNEDT